jgi:predicted nucleic acid-binding protein
MVNEENLNHSCVIDNSIVMVWAFEDENDPYATRILNAMPGRTALVPPIWLWEITNALVVARRRGRITDEGASLFYAQLDSMLIEVVQPVFLADMREVYRIAGQYRLTAYDAEYLALALRTHLPLATLDRDLLRAMGETGVPRFEP